MFEDRAVYEYTVFRGTRQQQAVTAASMALEQRFNRRAMPGYYYGGTQLLNYKVKWRYTITYHKLK